MAATLATIRRDNILTTGEINYILDLPEVQAAKSALDANNTLMAKQDGSVVLPQEILTKLVDSLGENLNLTNVSSIPFRWIRGDTPAHIDHGETVFMNTFLVYLTNSTGELIVGDEHYPIIAGTGYVFNEGETHETIGTNNAEPRLLIGPMSNTGFRVGIEVEFAIS